MNQSIVELKMNRLMPFRMRLLFCLLSAIGSVARADGEPPKPEDKPAEKPAKAPAIDQQKTEKSLLDQLTDALLTEEELKEAGQPADGTPEKMDRAVKGMRAAGNKLGEGLTADETVKIQKQVIKDLEDIINELENPPPQDQNNQGGGGGGSSSGGGGGKGGGGSGRSQGRSGSSASQRQRQQQRSGAQRGSRGQKSKSQSGADQQQQGEQSEGASDSSKEQQEKRRAAEEAARKKKLEMDVWGHLPPHLREELLNTYGDRMLPKYEQLVKQFYEALSTAAETRKNPSR